MIYHVFSAIIWSAIDALYVEYVDTCHANRDDVAESGGALECGDYSIRTSFASSGADVG